VVGLRPGSAPTAGQHPGPILPRETPARRRWGRRLAPFARSSTSGTNCSCRRHRRRRRRRRRTRHRRRRHRRRRTRRRAPRGWGNRGNVPTADREGSSEGRRLAYNKVRETNTCHAR